MLSEIQSFARRGESFAFETTLSGRSNIRLLRRLKARGYQIHVFFLWLRSTDLALSRIRKRVSRGGHDVPASVVRRRFDRSIRNFLLHYRPLADSWLVFDNSGKVPKVVALENRLGVRIINKSIYGALIKRYGSE